MLSSELGHYHICGLYERKIVMTGRNTGATSREFGEYIMATVGDPTVTSRWEAYTKA